MNSTYHNAVRDHGKTLITHIGLVNQSGVELTGGSYARLAETWVNDGNGVMRLAADRLFNVPAGIVAGWRGYSALTAGIDYGGAALTQENFAAAGQYRLLAAATAITHQAP